ncbi:MAG: GntR family transcriptional regulator [Victivallales bacterium]|nr:GntR family transcriptional regulator [Victivallales bacterium]
MEGLKITRHKSLRAQIVEYLREEILHGRIEPGSILPSTRALSEQWGTQTANVHAALSLLAQEGLITRKNGVGTIVNNRKKKLDTILVYERQNLCSPESSFQRILLTYIKEELDKRNINCRIVYRNQSADPLAEISELVDKELIQGVILPSTNRFERPWFEKLPVPFSCMTSARVKNRVFYNYHSLAENAAEGLSRQGCKRAGLLLSISDSPNPTESGEKERHDTIAAIRNCLAQRGIETRDEWIYTSDKSPSENIPDYTRYAFDGFNHIWSAAEKPDGLFVFTEDLISGTLIAMMTAQLRFPQDIKLVFHRNTGNTPLCPVPCYFIESNTRDVAAGLVNLVVDQYNGREIKEYRHEYELTKNKASNPINER